mmetsp:Transcript_23624/g.67568  ORF Transcript_23624/g.67568 Transcript_23624/m.67568 type:complete len:236 (-) Transcript_23624:211-918(-)
MGPVYFHTYISQSGLRSDTLSLMFSRLRLFSSACPSQTALPPEAPQRHSQVTSARVLMCARSALLNFLTACMSKPLERQNTMQSWWFCRSCMSTRKKGIPLAHGSWSEFPSALMQVMSRNVIFCPSRCLSDADSLKQPTFLNHRWYLILMSSSSMDNSPLVSSMSVSKNDGNRGGLMRRGIGNLMLSFSSRGGASLVAKALVSSGSNGTLNSSVWLDVSAGMLASGVAACLLPMT